MAWAAELGAAIAEHAARHDRDGTFVAEAYELLRSSGYLALAVPEELGGRGATIRQVAMAQRELARHCASTALASVMHHHVVLFTAWRYRRGLPGAEATLRRVADDGIVLVSTGGADLTRPRGEAVRVEGGYQVSGRKIFASQAPVGTVLSTMFPFDDPDEGRIVLNMAVPMASEGVTVLETWDALGMRGTGSHDVELVDVFVPDERVLARRPHGRIDAPLQVILSNAMPPIAAVYLGVAEAARDHAVAAVAGTAKADDPLVQRQVGLMDTRLRVAGVGAGRRPRHRGRRSRAVDGHRGRRHGGQAGDRPGRRRGVRPGHGGRRRGGLLPHLADRAVLPRRPRREVPPLHARRRRWSTPARSPWGCPPTRSEGRRPAGLLARALPGRASDPTLRALDVGEEVLFAS